VSDHPSTIPDVQFISSKGIYILPGKEAEDSRLPTKNEIQVISSKQAKKLFGKTSAQIIDGFSVCTVVTPPFCPVSADMHLSPVVGE